MLFFRLYFPSRLALVFLSFISFQSLAASINTSSLKKTSINKTTVVLITEPTLFKNNIKGQIDFTEQKILLQRSNFKIYKKLILCFLFIVLVIVLYRKRQLVKHYRDQEQILNNVLEKMQLQQKNKKERILNSKYLHKRLSARFAALLEMFNELNIISLENPDENKREIENIHVFAKHTAANFEHSLKAINSIE